MATVELAFSPLPAHVRTARLVATAVARRSGVAEPLLDEVRLAVGEACSRAVEAHQATCPAEPVRISLSDHAGRFEIEVTNTVVGPADGLGGGTAAAHADEHAAPSQPVPVGNRGGGQGGRKAAAAPAVPGSGIVPPGFSLAVIAGLADDVQVSQREGAMSVRMSWPLGGAAAPE